MKIGITDFQVRLLYESLPYHNAVFVGFDPGGQPRYAALRGTASPFKGEARGSDKRFAFCIRAPNSPALHVFEGAVDLLSLGGVSGKEVLPALGQFLHDGRISGASACA